MQKQWLSQGSKTNNRLTRKAIQYRCGSPDDPELKLYTSKLAARNQQKKHQSFSITPLMFKQTILAFLKEQFHSVCPSFENSCLKWMQSDGKQLRTDIQSRLNKLMYLQPTLQFDNFSEIQRQIKVQWRKSVLLKGIQLIWNHWFKTQRFVNLQKVQIFYNSLCRFITKVSLFLYHNSLKNLMAKQYPVQNKLRLQTAVAIITQNKEWTKIYTLVLQKYFSDQKSYFPQNYNLEKLKINSNILNIDKHHSLFNQTATSIFNLTTSLTIDQMVSNLKSFRSNLQKQIQHSVQIQLKENNKDEPVMVAKQQILSVIIYILISYKLVKVASTIKYMNFLMNQQTDKVMQWHKVSCWKANLQVACQFMVQPQNKLTKLKTQLETNQQ